MAAVGSLEAVGGVNGTEPSAPGAAPADQVAWISFTAALLLAGQIASKATRDALFLVAFDPRRLPSMMAAGAVASLVAIPFMSHALARWGPLRVLPRVLVLGAVLHVVEWSLLSEYPGLAAVVLYLHVSALGAVLLSGFWTMVSEHRDPHSRRRLVGRVTAAAALGATIGGLAVYGMSRFGGTRDVLLGLAGTTLATAVSTMFLRPTHAEAVTGEEPAIDGVLASMRHVGGSPYLRAIAAMSALVAMWEALLDFAFKTAAHDALPDEAALGAFFGLFYTGTSLVTFIVQAVLGKLAMRRGGLTASLAVSPAWVVLGASVIGGAPFTLLAVLRGGASVLANSFHRSAYEGLFVPIAAPMRRATKALVDVAATRVGDALGALVLFLLVDRGIGATLVVAGALGLVGIGLARPLGRGYVATLAESLREGVAVADAAPSATSNPAISLEGETVLSSAPEEASAPREAPRSPTPPSEPLASFAAKAGALTSKDPLALAAALAAPLEPELARLVLALLEHEVSRPAAEAAIRAVLPRTVGALVDALLDPLTPLPVRVRVPRLLVVAALPRAVHGLLLGLEDETLDVRMQCARALVRLEGAPLEREPVLAAILREITEHGTSWPGAAVEPTDDDYDPRSLDILVRAHASRSLRYVLVLLSLVTEAGMLEHALEGLSSTDPDVRGTALELLDNVAPEFVRGPLLAALDPRPAKLADAELTYVELDVGQDVTHARGLATAPAE